MMQILKLPPSNVSKVKLFVDFIARLKGLSEKIKFVVSKSAVCFLDHLDVDSQKHRSVHDLLQNEDSRECVNNQLIKLIKQYGVLFTRMDYRTKRKLVTLLKEDGQVTYVGDGSNDSLAMMEADVAIGIKGKKNKVGDFYIKSVGDYYKLLKASLAFSDNEFLIYSVFFLTVTLKNVVLLIILSNNYKLNQFHNMIVDILIGYVGINVLVKQRPNKKEFSVGGSQLPQGEKAFSTYIMLCVQKVLFLLLFNFYFVNNIDEDDKELRYSVV